MLYYDKIDAFEGIDNNKAKANDSHECIVCQHNHYQIRIFAFFAKCM